MVEIVLRAFATGFCDKDQEQHKEAEEPADDAPDASSFSSSSRLWNTLLVPDSAHHDQVRRLLENLAIVRLSHRDAGFCQLGERLLLSQERV